MDSPTTTVGGWTVPVIGQLGSYRRFFRFPTVAPSVLFIARSTECRPRFSVPAYGSQRKSSFPSGHQHLL